MMNNNSSSNKLSLLLSEIADYLEQLLAALNSEHQALSDNNLQAVQTIAQEKIVLMEQLEDLDKERRALLETAGLNLTSTGIEDFFLQNNSSQASKLKTAWDNIAALSKQCERQNNINGIVIESNKRHTENALAILQGKQQNAELYSNTGKSIRTSNAQTSIRA